MDFDFNQCTIAGNRTYLSLKMK